MTVFRLEEEADRKREREKSGIGRRGGVGLPSYLPEEVMTTSLFLTSHWQLKVMLMQLIYAHQHFNYLYNSAFSDKTRMGVFSIFQMMLWGHIRICMSTGSCCILAWGSITEKQPHQEAGET